MTIHGSGTLACQISLSTLTILKGYFEDEEDEAVVTREPITEDVEKEEEEKRHF